jgi:hypothetical protein
MRTAPLLSEAAPSRVDPFVGPRPFGENDVDRFFGRSAVTDELFALVSAFQSCVVYGQSGTGKSSLIYAGLLPAARAAGIEVLPVARVQNAGVEGWTRQGNPFVHYTLSSWGMRPCGDPTGVSAALYRPNPPLDPYGDPRIRLAVFDQFEELFTALPGHWEERVPFLDDLATALREDPRLRMVFVVREDHLADVLDAVAPLPDGLKAQLRLPRLDHEEAIEAIEGPVHRLTHLRFADGVVEDLVKDLMTIKVRRGVGAAGETTGECVEPVQLQVVCTELWRSLPTDTHVITSDQVANLGDPTSALAHFYEDCVAETSRRARVSRAFTRRWFERVLITPAGTRATAWQGDRDTAGMPNAAVADLENRHMLRAEDRAGARWYEINHDRFIAAIKQSNASARSRALATSWGLAAVAIIVGALLVSYSWQHGGLARVTLMFVGLLVPVLGVTAAMVRTLDAQMPPLGVRRRWWWAWGTLAALAGLIFIGGLENIFSPDLEPVDCTASAFNSYAESVRGTCFGGARAYVFGWGLGAGICIGLMLGVLWRIASTRRRKRRFRKMSLHPAASAPPGPAASDHDAVDTELASVARSG